MGFVDTIAAPYRGLKTWTLRKLVEAQTSRSTGPAVRSGADGGVVTTVTVASLGSTSMTEGTVYAATAVSVGAGAISMAGNEFLAERGLEVRELNRRAAAARDVEQAWAQGPEALYAVLVAARAEADGIAADQAAVRVDHEIELGRWREQYARDRGLTPKESMPDPWGAARSAALAYVAASVLPIGGYAAGPEFAGPAPAMLGGAAAVGLLGAAEAATEEDDDDRDVKGGAVRALGVCSVATGGTMALAVASDALISANGWNVPTLLASGVALAAVPLAAGLRKLRTGHWPGAMHRDNWSRRELIAADFDPFQRLDLADGFAPRKPAVAAPHLGNPEFRESRLVIPTGGPQAEEIGVRYRRVRDAQGQDRWRAAAFDSGRLRAFAAQLASNGADGDLRSTVLDAVAQTDRSGLTIDEKVRILGDAFATLPDPGRSVVQSIHLCADDTDRLLFGLTNGPLVLGQMLAGSERYQHHSIGGDDGVYSWARADHDVLQSVADRLGRVDIPDVGVHHNDPSQRRVVLGWQQTGPHTHIPSSHPYQRPTPQPAGLNLVDQLDGLLAAAESTRAAVPSAAVSRRDTSERPGRNAVPSISS